MHKTIACLYHKALSLAETQVQKSRIWVDLCLLVAKISTSLAEQCALKAIQLHADKNACYAMALARKTDMEQAVHYASKAIAMDQSFAPPWKLLLEITKDEGMTRELRERARHACPNDHFMAYHGLEEHSYTSLKQLLSLRPSGPRPSTIWSKSQSVPHIIHSFTWHIWRPSCKAHWRYRTRMNGVPSGLPPG